MTKPLVNLDGEKFQQVDIDKPIVMATAITAMIITILNYLGKVCN